MSAAKLLTLADIESLVLDKVPESTTLEYKSAKVIEAQDVGTIVKAVTAFANSVGGNLIIGVESVKGVPDRLSGAKVSSSKLDWLYKVIQSNSQPPVESLECHELIVDSGLLYLVRVHRSPSAPHQASDGRYYKRRGSHSEVLEHYEIEDIRSRPKVALLPLRLDFFLPKFVVYLRVRNTSVDQYATNIKVEIEANFDLDRRAIKNVSATGMRQLSPQEERLFLLESVPTMLELNPDPILKAFVSYEYQGVTVRDEALFYARDVQDSIVKDSWEETLADKFAPKVERLQRSIDAIGRSLAQLARASDATGLRFSQRTLNALLRRDAEKKFEPSEFDWEGYVLLLDISADDAIALHSVFNTIGTPDDKARQYAALPEELRFKFESVFDLSDYLRR